MKPELKFKDIAHVFGGAAIPTTGVVGTSINLLSAGNTPSTIVGRRIILRRITIKGSVTKVASSNATLTNVTPGDNVRIMLVWDKQTNGAQAAVADVMDAASGTRGQLNMENAQRFVVLKEWMINLNMDTSHDGTNYFAGGATTYFKWSKKCFIPIAYDNAAGSVITDIRDNNLFLQAISDQASCTALATSRIRYADL